jgi:alpha-glucosidase
LLVKQKKRQPRVKKKPQPNKVSEHHMDKNKNTAFPYWKGGVFYQIYPRSFYDSDNDGIGDLPGITKKLDHVASLGVDGVWISPFFPSPMKDFGYDVSNYRDVDPIFGTLDDFKALLARAHELDLKIIIDLVLSHTSDQHPWFQNSLSGGDTSDYYVWANGKTDPDTGKRAPPNNWASVFGGSAWTWSEEREQYYFHNFLKERPDLNFHNPAVQVEALGIAKFWLDMGIDGFRLDVVNFYAHDQQLRDNPPNLDQESYATQFEGNDPYSAQLHVYDKSQPETLDFLRKFRALMDDYEGTFTIGEIGDDDPYARAAEYTDGKDLLHTTYNPQMMSGKQKALTPGLIRAPFEKFAQQPGTGWPSWAFSNHDVVRAASRWHSDPSGHAHSPALSQMLMTLLCTLHGTVFVYQGEELGLPETQLEFDDIQDPWGKHLWPKWQGRDGCRTPMPWDTSEYAGFSASRPWLPVNDDHKALSIAAQNADKASTLNFVRDVLTWRKTYPVFQNGEIVFHDTGHKDILAFERRNKTHAVLCLFNLSKQTIPLQEFTLTQRYPDLIQTPSLKPYGFLILEND